MRYFFLPQVGLTLQFVTACYTGVFCGQLHGLEVKGFRDSLIQSLALRLEVSEKVPTSMDQLKQVENQAEKGSDWACSFSGRKRDEELRDGRKRKNNSGNVKVTFHQK